MPSSTRKKTRIQESGNNQDSSLISKEEKMDPKLRRHALLLSYFTVLYSLIEGILSLLAGSFAGSISPIGFGLWRADPIIGFIVAAFLIREGLETLE